MLKNEDVQLFCTHESCFLLPVCDFSTFLMCVSVPWVQRFCLLFQLKNVKLPLKQWTARQQRTDDWRPYSWMKPRGAFHRSHAPNRALTYVSIKYLRLHYTDVSTREINTHIHSPTDHIIQSWVHIDIFNNIHFGLSDLLLLRRNIWD